MSNPNVNQKLHALQDMVIDEFITRIKTGEATPSDLNAARQLLKDNGIHCSMKQDNPLKELVEALPFQDEKDKILQMNHG